MHHLALLTAPGANLLELEGSGELALFDDADDCVIWDQVSDGFKHIEAGGYSRLH